VTEGVWEQSPKEKISKREDRKGECGDYVKRIFMICVWNVSER
jgi:hypothetical protein